MDDKIDLLDDSTIIIRSLLKEAFGSTFNAYYEGDPVLIPKSSLPCIIVENVVTAVDQAATSQDEIGEQLSIKVVLNKADDYGKSDDYDSTERKLRRFIQGRDKVTRHFHHSTLLYVLRKNITLKGLALNSRVDISYDLQPRPNQMVTSEANISVVVTQRVMSDRLSG